MADRKTIEKYEAGERALMQLLARLPEGATTTAMRLYVEKLRRDASRPRPKPRNRAARLRRDRDDADVALVLAKQAGSTQAMVSALRQLREIETEIEDEAKPKPGAPPPIDLATATIVQRLEWQQHGLVLQLEVAREQGDVAGFGNIDRRLQEVGTELDAARLRASRLRVIERTPTAIAAAIAERAPMIEIRAEMTRRRQARAAAAEAEAEALVPRERDL